MASVFSQMQETRGELLHGDKQDIQLGQLLDTAKDAIKDQFAAITMQPITKRKIRGKK